MTAPKKVKAPSFLVVYTGNGKGKTTAAFGMAFRAMGWGHKVAVVQYIKGKWKTGERQFAQTMPLMTYHVMGMGFTWESKDLAKDEAAAKQAWEKSKELIAGGEHPLVVLDELTYPIRYGFLSEEDVVAALTARPPHVSVVVTGRHATKALIDAADLVSEMTPIKHPYADKDVKALKGVDF